MSKSFSNVNIDMFNNATDMDSIYAGNTPVENIPTKPVETTKNVKSKTTTKKSDTIEHKKTISTDKEGNVRKDKEGNVIYNKQNNYSITFKIDADIEDFLKNILWINRKNKNQYVNDLIRADMIKLLNLNEDATYEEMQRAWDKYKKANNI